MKIIVHGENGFVFEVGYITADEIGNILSAMMRPSMFGTDAFRVEIKRA